MRRGLVQMNGGHDYVFLSVVLTEKSVSRFKKLFVFFLRQILRDSQHPRTIDFNIGAFLDFNLRQSLSNKFIRIGIRI